MPSQSNSSTAHWMVHRIHRDFTSRKRSANIADPELNGQIAFSGTISALQG